MSSSSSVAIGLVVGGRRLRDGVDADPPPLPDDHLADCYTVGLRDLLTPDGEIHKSWSGLITASKLAELTDELIATLG